MRILTLDELMQVTGGLTKEEKKALKADYKDDLKDLKQQYKDGDLSKDDYKDAKKARKALYYSLKGSGPVPS